MSNLNNVITLTGELNFMTVPALSKKYQRLLRISNSLVFDLAQVSSVDNTGVALLVALARQAKNVQQELVFVNLQPQVLALLEAVGVQKMLVIKT